MPDKLPELLGFRDLAEAIFAITQQIEGESQLVTAYGNAQQGKMATLERAVEALQTTTPSGLQVTVPADITLEADHLGTVKPGQLPKLISLVVDQFGSSMLADPRTSVVFTPNGVLGSEISNGVFQVSAVTKPLAEVRVVVTFGGVEQGNWTVKVSMVKDPPPPPVPVTPTPTPTPTPTVTPAASVWLDVPAQAGVFQLAGKVDVVGGFTYKAVLNAGFYSLAGGNIESNVRVYIARKTGNGAWVQEGAIVVGSPTAFYQEFDYAGGWEYTSQVFASEQSPGAVNITREIVLPSGSHSIGFFVELSYGPTVSFSSPAIVQPA